MYNFLQSLEESLVTHECTIATQLRHVKMQPLLQFQTQGLEVNVPTRIQFGFHHLEYRVDISQSCKMLTSSRSKILPS